VYLTAAPTVVRSIEREFQRKIAFARDPQSHWTKVEEAIRKLQWNVQLMRQLNEEVEAEAQNGDDVSPGDEQGRDVKLPSNQSGTHPALMVLADSNIIGFVGARVGQGLASENTRRTSTTDRSILPWGCVLRGLSWPHGPRIPADA
jgi:hypothetical protein